MKLHDGNQLQILDFGDLPYHTETFVTIDLSPEEILEYWSEYGARETKKQLDYLLHFYKQND